MLAISLGFHPQAKSAQPATETSGTEPQFYTIQIGSFTNEEEAVSWYNRLGEQLPTDLKQYLRIESIPPFHTVRVGKAENRPDIIKLLEETQKITKKPPAILHGYYRPERIIKLYDSTASPGQPAATPEAQKNSPPEESLTTEPGAKSTPLPPRPEEPLDTPSDTKSATKAKPRRAAHRRLLRSAGLRAHQPR